MSVIIGIDVGGSTTKICAIKNGELLTPACVTANDPLASVYGAFGKYTAENGSGALYRINNCEKRESHEHFHLKCNSCGKLIHMDCTLLAKIAEHLQSDHGFFMDNSKTVLYGQCEECICKKELCCHE